MAEFPIEICEFIWAGTAASAGRVRSATLPCFLEIYTGAQFQAVWARPCKLLLVRVDLRTCDGGCLRLCHRAFLGVSANLLRASW